MKKLMGLVAATAVGLFTLMLGTGVLFTAAVVWLLKGCRPYIKEVL